MKVLDQEQAEKLAEELDDEKKKAERPPADSLAGKVLEALERAPTSADALVEVTRADTKKVRNAVTALRRRYAAGHELHPIAHEGRYWLSRDLEAKGYELVETRGGNLKVKKDDAPVSKDNARDVLENALKGKPATPENVTRLIAEQLAIVDYASVELRKAREFAKELVGGREAAFRSAVEAGRELNDNDGALEKLMQVEQTWQELEDARAEATEMRKLHRDTLKEQGTLLRKIMKAAKALNIVEAIEAGAGT